MSIDIETVISVISSVGFPIVMCGALFWKINKQDEEHKEEMAKVTEALNNNTEALRELLKTMGVGSDAEEDMD